MVWKIEFIVCNKKLEFFLEILLLPVNIICSIIKMGFLNFRFDLDSSKNLD
jgi:hypothetical protein